MTRERSSRDIVPHQPSWDLKDSETDYDLTWSLVKTAPIYNHTTGICRLCNLEKILIMFKPEGATINDRSEFYSTCRHRLKSLLIKNETNLYETSPIKVI